MAAEPFPVKSHGEFTLENPPKAEWLVHQQLAESKFGDVQFQFDNKTVHAHSMILGVRSVALYQLYEKETSGKKRKKHKGVVTLKIPQPHNDYPITSDTFELVLQFLYADNIQFETLSARQSLDLVIAADVFQISRLARLARDRVKESISLDNLHSLLKVAHDTKEERVRGYCVAFASKHRKDFIGRKDQVGHLGVDLFQDVMELLMSGENLEVNEKDPVPSSTLLGDFRKLYTDLDMGAIQGDSTVSFKGAEIAFHKSFFTTHSKALSLSFQSVADGPEVTTEILKVKGLLTTPDSFRAILRYLYFGDLNGFTVLIACEVQEFAKTHGMVELQQICEFIMAVNINVDAVMSIMKVVFNPGNIKRPDLAELRANTLTFFIQNIVKLQLSLPALLMNGPLVMAEIILAWQAAEQAKLGVEGKARRPSVHDGSSGHESSGIKNSESLQSLDGSESHEKEKKKKKKKRDR